MGACEFISSILWGNRVGWGRVGDRNASIYEMRMDDGFRMYFGYVANDGPFILCTALLMVVKISIRESYTCLWLWKLGWQFGSIWVSYNCL